MVQQADHLAFKDKGVNWDIWVSATGDPVPLKFQAEFTDNKASAQDRVDVQQLELRADGD
jgi:hypothetical protein